MTLLNTTDRIYPVEDRLFKKLMYIARHDGRTTEEEIELMINEWIRAFEDVCGKITTD